MTNEEAKVFLDNLKICINEHPIVADWLVEIENRNDEPSDSEKPNNCEPQTDCPQSNICGKPCKECGACEEECGLWKKLSCPSRATEEQEELNL